MARPSFVFRILGEDRSGPAFSKFIQNVQNAGQAVITLGSALAQTAAAFGRIGQFVGSLATRSMVAFGAAAFAVFKALEAGASTVQTTGKEFSELADSLDITAEQAAALSFIAARSGDSVADLANQLKVAGGELQDFLNAEIGELNLDADDLDNYVEGVKRVTETYEALEERSERTRQNINRLKLVFQQFTNPIQELGGVVKEFTTDALADLAEATLTVGERNRRWGTEIEEINGLLVRHGEELVRTSAKTAEVNEVYEVLGRTSERVSRGLGERDVPEIVKLANAVGVTVTQLKANDISLKQLYDAYKAGRLTLEEYNKLVDTHNAKINATAAAHREAAKAALAFYDALNKLREDGVDPRRTDLDPLYPTRDDQLVINRIRTAQRLAGEGGPDGDLGGGGYGGLTNRRGIFNYPAGVAGLLNQQRSWQPVEVDVRLNDDRLEVDQERRRSGEAGDDPTRQPRLF